MTSGSIMIVEDNTIQREGLAIVLRQLGFTVLSAANGQEALDRLEHLSADLILLDMLIPDGAGDGWWFLHQRQRDARLSSIPVLITTALSIANNEWASSLGAAGVLRKPIDIEPLKAAIQHCLGRG